MGRAAPLLPRQGALWGELRALHLFPGWQGVGETPTGRLTQPLLPAALGRSPVLWEPAATGREFPRLHGYARCTAVQTARLARKDQGPAHRDARAQGNVRRAPPFLPSYRPASPALAHKT